MTEAAVRPRESRWPRLLRRPPFRRYWSAQTVSLFGDQISGLAIPLVAVLTTGAGAAQMGYLTAAGLLPSLLFSMLAGAWVDGVAHKRRLMVLADAGRAVALTAVPALWWTGTLTLPLLYATTFVAGTLSVLFEVARSSLFVTLVERPDYIEANTLLNGARAMSTVAGPSIGGLLVQALGAPVALLGDVLSYVASALFLGRTPATERLPAEPRRKFDIGGGLRIIGHSPNLRHLLLGSTTLNLFNYMFAALFVLYVTTVLHVHAGTLGLVLGAGAFGGLLGAALTGRLARRFGIGRTLLISFVLFPAPLLLVPLAAGPHPVVLALLAVAEFVSATGVIVLDITAGAIQTAATPHSTLALMQGAQRTVNYGIRPIGALLGGALGAVAGLHTALWISATGALTGSLWIMAGPLAALTDLPPADGV
jgi:MFS family permease